MMPFVALSLIFLGSVNRLEVLALFSTLIGDIRASQDSDDALEITFFTADSARYVEFEFRDLNRANRSTGRHCA
jgi:hypothetical protein